MPERQPCPICAAPVSIVDSVEDAVELTGVEPDAVSSEPAVLYSKCPRCETKLQRNVAPGAKWEVEDA